MSFSTHESRSAHTWKPISTLGYDSVDFDHSSFANHQIFLLLLGPITTCLNILLVFWLSISCFWPRSLISIWLPKILYLVGIHKNFCFIYNFIIIIILFLAVLGLCCSASFSLVAASRGYPPVAVCRLFIAVASLVELRLKGAWPSLVAALGLSSCSSWVLDHSLNSCGAWAEFLHGIWGLSRSEIEHMSPALVGEFFTTEPPRKPCKNFLTLSFWTTWDPDLTLVPIIISLCISIPLWALISNSHLYQQLWPRPNLLLCPPTFPSFSFNHVDLCKPWFLIVNWPWYGKTKPQKAQSISDGWSAK